MVKEIPNPSDQAGKSVEELIETVRTKKTIHAQKSNKYDLAYVYETSQRENPRFQVYARKIAPFLKKIDNELPETKPTETQTELKAYKKWDRLTAKLYKEKNFGDIIAFTLLNDNTINIGYKENIIFKEGEFKIPDPHTKISLNKKDNIWRQENTIFSEAEHILIQKTPHIANTITAIITDVPRKKIETRTTTATPPVNLRELANFMVSGQVPTPKPLGMQQ